MLGAPAYGLAVGLVGSGGFTGVSGEDGFADVGSLPGVLLGNVGGVRGSIGSGLVGSIGFICGAVLFRSLVSVRLRVPD